MQRFIGRLCLICGTGVRQMITVTLMTAVLHGQTRLSSRDNQAIHRLDSLKVWSIQGDLRISSEPSFSEPLNFRQFSTDRPLEPDPSAVGVGAFFGGSPGHFVPRACDLFLDDGTDFSQPIAITSNTVALRALYPYDMNLDPLYEANGDRREILSRPGLSLLTSGEVQNHEGDPILYIDLAVFYDDNEFDGTGGFWANWKIQVAPAFYSNGSWLPGTPGFKTKLRGPFWSGEKLEVGDTGGSFRPQAMHYMNFGIWNWNWTVSDAVRVLILEGDAGFFDDIIAEIVVLRGETTAKSVTLADTGDEINLLFTADNRFKRVVSNGSRVDSIGRPRVIENPDGHDVDITFNTRPLGVPNNSNLTFSDRYVVGFNRLKGSERNEPFAWQTGINLGPQHLRFIDNISYTAGWDCESKTDPFYDPYDVDDDFEFFIYPDETGGNVVTNRGGCNSTTTLFFRSTQVSLPDFVQIKPNAGGRIRIPAGTGRTISIPKTPGYLGFVFTELLAYESAGDDDVGFRIEKSADATHYSVTASVFDAPASAAIHLRATVIEWPSSDLGVTHYVRMSTRAANSGFAHGVTDLAIPNSALPYFVINEILTYDPDGDDDMSWSLYFERLQSHVDFQLASGNAAGSGAYVEAEAHIVQFQGQGIVSQNYVDGSNSGFENGSAAFPWNTIDEGVNWVSSGGNVWIAPGSYPEIITINKAATLLRNGTSGPVVIGEQ